MGSMAMGRWAVLMTGTLQEQRARDNILRQAIEVYLPLLRERRAVRGRVADHVVALFPRYIFARVKAGDEELLPRQLVALRSTRGVSSVVMSTGEVPAYARDCDIELLRGMQDREGFIKLPERPAKTLVRGDAVIVASGSMLGSIGIVEGMRGTERVKVLFQMLGRAVSADLSARIVDPVVAAAAA